MHNWKNSNRPWLNLVAILYPRHSILRVGQILAVASLWLSVSSQAQTPWFRDQAFKEKGAIGVTTMLQDSKGWLWFGGTQGLYRYDGSLMYKVSAPASVQSVAITALFEINELIWVGFDNGAIAHIPVINKVSSPSTNEIQDQSTLSAPLSLWLPQEGVPTQKITAFADDGQGGIWFSTYGEGVYIWKENRLYQYNQADDGLAGDEVYTLISDPKGHVWAATDAGISICSMKNMGKKQVENISIEEGLPDEIITTLHLDSDGNILVGTQDKGICSIDVHTKACTVITPRWPHCAVTQLEIFGKQEIWVGTEKEGLFCLNTALIPAIITTPPEACQIKALKKDREGLLWYITNKGDVYMANARYSTIELPFNNIQAVCIDKQARKWIGTAQGLYMETQGKLTRVLPAKHNIISLWEDDSGSVWVGTFGDGIWSLNAAGNINGHWVEKDGLSNGSILSITGQDGHLWLATLGGVTEMKRRSNGQYQLSNLPEMVNKYVYKVFCDSKKRVWFGTDGQGLRVLEQGGIKHYSTVNGIELKTIYSIAEDTKGRIWFGTDREGLFCFDGVNFKNYTTKNNLHSMSIIGVACNASGQVVVAYENGFDLLDPERVDHVTFCDVANGVPLSEINLNGICKDPQGHIWLGTKKGLVRAADFQEYFNDDPQPSIIDISIFLKPIDYLSQHYFSHNQNYFTFHFTGLWYTQPESVRYRYMLEGLDLNWTISKDQLASYPNLPPGHYIFRLQASEHGNFDNVPETTWEFTIAPPFWVSWWFLLAAITAVTMLTYRWIKNRDAIHRREALLNKEKADSQFAALKSQINPHFLFNSFNTLITIIEENPKIAVEYVENLSDYYRTIMVYREKDFISIQEEIELVVNFTFLLKKRYEHNFHVKNLVPHDQIGFIMPLTLQMLLENAVKHNIISTAHPLIVEIYIENGYIVVRNNIQPKIRPEVGTHFGLQSLQHRYQLTGQLPVVIEKKNHFFTVKIPIWAQKL